MVNTNSVLSSILFSQTIDWNIKQFFSSTSINSSFELKRIGKAITRRKDQMVVEDDKRYKRITIKTNCGGVFVRDEVLGKDIKTKKQYYVKAGQLAVSKIDARNGAFGIVPPEADGAIITGNFWVYDVNPEIANIDYLILLSFVMAILISPICRNTTISTPERSMRKYVLLQKRSPQNSKKPVQMIMIF